MSETQQKNIDLLLKKLLHVLNVFAVRIKVKLQKIMLK